MSNRKQHNPDTCQLLYCDYCDDGQEPLALGNNKPAMTQHTTNTPTNSNAPMPMYHSPRAWQDTNSNADEQKSLFIRTFAQELLSATRPERVIDHYEKQHSANYLPKAKVVEAINSAASFYDYEDGVEVAYNVAADAKRKLGLESE